MQRPPTPKPIQPPPDNDKPVSAEIDYEKLADLIAARIPKPKDGVDGKDGPPGPIGPPGPAADLTKLPPLTIQFLDGNGQVWEQFTVNWQQGQPIQIPAIHVQNFDVSGTHAYEDNKYPLGTPIRMKDRPAQQFTSPTSN